MIQIESLIVPVTIGFWLIMATWFFYWLFLMREKNPEDKLRRGFYFWGWVRFCSFTLLFTAGGVFFNMRMEEWNIIYIFFQENITKIIAGTFWLLAIVIFGYFLIYRGLKRRKKLEI